MKNIVIPLLLSSLLSCTNQDNHEQKAEEMKTSGTSGSEKPRISDSLFQYHFRILDSAAKYPYKDTMHHCCHSSVEFMEEVTHIPSDSDGDYFGSTGFKKEDLIKWHNWYDSVKAIK